jgi:hypothetical protein
VKTKFKNKCAILADIWLNYRDDQEFADFIEYNDLGLPLAYAIESGIVEKTERAKSFIEETFELLLAGLGIEEDTGFEDLEEVLEAENGFEED